MPGDAPMKAIEAERRRQIEIEGWSRERDKRIYSAGQLYFAAQQYYKRAAAGWLHDDYRTDRQVPRGWPWNAKWWKPKTPWRDLERAGALCLAEMDRVAGIACDDAGDCEEIAKALLTKIVRVMTLIQIEELAKTIPPALAGFTAGPWEAKGPDPFGDWTIAPKGRALAVAAVVSNMQPPAEVAANARLVAAAPALAIMARLSKAGDA